MFIVFGGKRDDYVTRSQVERMIDNAIEEAINYKILEMISDATSSIKRACDYAVNKQYDRLIENLTAVIDEKTKRKPRQTTNKTEKNSQDAAKPSETPSVPKEIVSVEQIPSPQDDSIIGASGDDLDVPM